MRACLVVLILIATSCSGGSTPRSPAPSAGSAAARPAPGACPEGQAVFAHGCGGGPEFPTGCYATCEGGKACARGTCTKVTRNPCHEQSCDACGSPAELCLP